MNRLSNLLPGIKKRSDDREKRGALVRVLADSTAAESAGAAAADLERAVYDFIYPIAEMLR